MTSFNIARQSSLRAGLPATSTAMTVNRFCSSGLQAIVMATQAIQMGIGPVFAIPKLLKQTGLSAADIDLWEINEAFASQALYCQQTLDIPSSRLNVNGGSISIGHPFGMTGARMSGHLLIEGKRRGAKYGVVSMCIAGGMGAAALFEIF